MLVFRVVEASWTSAYWGRSLQPSTSGFTDLGSFWGGAPERGSESEQLSASFLLLVYQLRLQPEIHRPDEWSNVRIKQATSAAGSSRNMCENADPGGKGGGQRDRMPRLHRTLTFANLDWCE